AAFNVAMLNSYYRIRDNDLTITEEGIRFSDFTLIDSAQNTATLDGMVYTRTFTDFRFDLDLRSRNYHMINSTVGDNEHYYGKLFINSNLSIGGDMNAPVVDGTLRVNENTDFTIV